MVPLWAIITGKHRSSLFPCVVILLGLVELNFSSRSSPEHVDSWQTSVDSEKAVPRGPRKPPRSSERKESPLQVVPSSASIQVDGSTSAAANLSTNAGLVGGCCCYTRRNVATMKVYQKVNELDPMAVQQYDSESISYSPFLITNEFGEEGVDVLYRLVKQGVPEDQQESMAKGAEFEEKFIPLSVLPKSKCPRSSRVRLFVGEAEEFEGRIDAENCVWKDYGCGHMRRRAKADSDDKCADAIKADGQKIVAQKKVLDGFWLTKEATDKFCDPRIDREIRDESAERPRFDRDEPKLKSSAYSAKEHAIVFALLVML